MARGYTIFDLAWPRRSDEFERLAEAFSENIVLSIIDATWRGCDKLKDDLLSLIDASKADEELERAITQLLEPKIKERLTGEEPFYVQHGPYEFETRKRPPAQPPQYDLAFVWVSNPRIMWPIEAKVLRSDKAVARYVRAVEDFVKGRYAPFVRSSALLGYLFAGSPEGAFARIGGELGIPLERHSHFGSRPHRVSAHNRVSEFDGAAVGVFRCHHLVLEVV